MILKKKNFFQEESELRGWPEAQHEIKKPPKKQHDLFLLQIMHDHYWCWVGV